MQRFLLVFALLSLSVTIYADTYYRCGKSDKYHIFQDCDGLKKCKSEIKELNETQAFKLKICRYCESSFEDLEFSVGPASSFYPDRQGTWSHKSKSPHFYWLRYLLLGIVSGLFKLGKRWEVIGAAIGLGIFSYWMIQYFDARTFKLSYCITQSSLFALGFALSQTLITQIYKNRESDSLISAMMNALSTSEAELHESKKTNETLEQQIRKLNLTQKQTEDALRQSQQIIAELKRINPQTNSAKIVPVKNEKHRKYLIDALKTAKNRK